MIESLPGNVTSVVRIGDTVRRSTGPNAPAAHALLRHLSTAGFDAAPRFHGIDEHGREVLDFIPGSSPHALDYDLAALRAVGAAIRRLHDVTATLALPGDRAWHDPPGGTGPLVICHNDLAPRNTVRRRDGSPVFIDWDGAGPAPREWDIAHAVWQFAYIGPQALAERPREIHEARIRALLDGYGRDNFDPGRVIDLYIPVTQRTLEAIANHLAAGTLRGEEPQRWMADIREQQAWATVEDAWLRSCVR